MSIALQRNFAFGQSVLLHVVLALAFWTGVPYLSRDLVIDQPVLTVDLVETALVTNLEEGTDIATPEERPEIAAGVRERAQALPEAPPERSEAEAEPLPEAPPQRPEAKAEPLPDTAAAVIPKPAPIRPARIAEAPQNAVIPIEETPEFKERQEKRIALNKALQDLTQRETGRPDAEAEENEDEKKKDVLNDIDRLAGQALNVQRVHPGALGVTVLDRVRSHITKHWNPPAGAAGADAIVVELTITLNPDAEVVTTEFRNYTRYRNDVTYKAAADAARRAVVSASPLPLPRDQYEEWKVINLNFKPVFITGG